MLRIGVIGYSAQEFDEKKAKEEIIKAFDKIEKKYSMEDYCVVSGYTNLGIPQIAYQEATKRKWKTVGVACKKSSNYDTFPCDEEIIVGEDWGDESERFLQEIDCIVKIGGGEQSKKEVRKAKKKNIPVEHAIKNI